MVGSRRHDDRGLAGSCGSNGLSQRPIGRSLLKLRVCDRMEASAQGTGRGGNGWAAGSISSQKLIEERNGQRSQQSKPCGFVFLWWWLSLLAKNGTKRYWLKTTLVGPDPNASKLLSAKYTIEVLGKERMPVRGPFARRRKVVYERAAPVRPRIQRHEPGLRVRCASAMSFSRAGEGPAAARQPVVAAAAAAAADVGVPT